MTDALEVRIAAARAAIDEKEWLDAKLKDTIAESNLLDARVDELEAAAKKEQGDVDALEGFGLHSVLHSVLGGKDAKLEKERGEALAARLKHEAARAELAEARVRIRTLSGLVNELGDVKAQYEAVLADKQRWLVEQGDERGGKVLEWAERKGQLTTKLREVNEAVEAAQEADAIMDKMLGYLREARGWGYADIVGVQAGGDPLSDGWSKYDAFGAAHVDAVDARHALSRLQSALKDVHLAELEVELPSSMVKFADWFFDGLAADVFVQSKICQSVASVEKAQVQVQAILEQLVVSKAAVAGELGGVTAAIRAEVES